MPKGKRQFLTIFFSLSYWWNNFTLALTPNVFFFFHFLSRESFENLNHQINILELPRQEIQFHGHCMVRAYNLTIRVQGKSYPNHGRENKYVITIQPTEYMTWDWTFVFSAINISLLSFVDPWFSHRKSFDVDRKQLGLQTEMFRLLVLRFAHTDFISKAKKKKIP